MKRIPAYDVILTEGLALHRNKMAKGNRQLTTLRDPSLANSHLLRKDRRRWILYMPPVYPNIRDLRLQIISKRANRSFRRRLSTLYQPLLRTRRPLAAAEQRPEAQPVLQIVSSFMAEQHPIQR